VSLFALRRAVVLSGEIELTADDRAGLRALVNSAGVRATVVTRARIVLWRAEDRQKADAAALAGGRGRRSTCDCLGTPVMGSLGCWTGPRGAGLWDVLWKINPILRGWAAYFRYGASKKTFSYLGWYAWWRMIYWIRRKHPHLTWKQIRRRYYGTDRMNRPGSDGGSQASEG
jgi:hypothetical protein